MKTNFNFINKIEKRIYILLLLSFFLCVFIKIYFVDVNFHKKFTSTNKSNKIYLINFSFHFSESNPYTNEFSNMKINKLINQKFELIEIMAIYSYSSREIFYYCSNEYIKSDLKKIIAGLWKCNNFHEGIYIFNNKLEVIRCYNKKEKDTEEFYNFLLINS